MRTNWCHKNELAASYALEVVRLVINKLQLGSWVSECNILCRHDEISPSNEAHKYEFHGSTNTGKEFDMHVLLENERDLPINGEFVINGHRGKHSLNAAMQAEIFVM